MKKQSIQGDNKHYIYFREIKYVLDQRYFEKPGAHWKKLNMTFRYNEVCDPGYEGLGEVESGPNEAGHFSQVVWKESTVLGIGRAEIEQDGMKCAYIVGRYQPAGNLGGSYRVNVLKGSFHRDVYCPTAVKKMSTGPKESNTTTQDNSIGNVRS